MAINDLQGFLFLFSVPISGMTNRTKKGSYLHQYDKILNQSILPKSIMPRIFNSFSPLKEIALATVIPQCEKI